MKSELRKKFSAVRRALAPEARAAADRAICSRFLELFGDRHKFFVYMSKGAEADTRNLIEALISRGKRVFLPVTEGEEMFAVEYNVNTPLIMSNFGTLEPKGPHYIRDIDVAVVPLLAVDGRGVRLGYGGGYYDRFLSARPMLRVGIGYSLQLAEGLPADEWDEPLDIFISEREVITFAKHNG